MKIRVGSRDSRLAVIQSQIVMDAVKRVHPEIELELVTMKTTGDLILDRTLDKVGGKGLFVKELDRALLEGRVDITVHSLKDMPMELHPSLPIVAVSSREEARDALVLPLGTDKLKEKPVIGCSSFRRRLHLELLFPGCEVRPVRGNVITRLEKLDRGEYDALVLAGAGLIRLGLEGRISRFFEPEEILPAACQGILGVQAHESLDTWFLKEFHDEQARKIAMAERAFVRDLNGGCSSPAAAYGKIEQDRLLLTGFDAQSGRRWMKRETISGPLDDGESLGIALARKIKEAEGSGCVAR